jgi:hypothetical protein
MKIWLRHGFTCQRNILTTVSKQKAASLESSFHGLSAIDDPN